MGRGRPRRPAARDRGYRALEQGACPSGNHLEHIADADEHQEERRDRCGLGIRDGHPPARTLPVLAASLRNAGGAVMPDRSRDHAVGADRASAPGAMHAGGHRRVAIAMVAPRRGRRDHRLLFHVFGHVVVMLRVKRRKAASRGRFRAARPRVRPARRRDRTEAPTARRSCRRRRSGTATALSGRRHVTASRLRPG